MLCSEVMDMSSKELNYVADALGHEQFMKTQFQDAANTLTDPELKALVSQLTQKHQELFNQFFALV